MCDEAMLERWAKGVMSRREFTAVTGAAALAACSGGSEPEASEGNEGQTSMQLSEFGINIKTADGVMDGMFVAPPEGDAPGVIMWPDIAGIREAKRAMARRLAGEGYAVLLLNPYYRDVNGEQFADFASFASSGGFDTVKPWRARFSAETIATDTRAAGDWLSRADGVDKAQGIGVQGYCMTGSFAVLGAAADDRIKAAASFHGGGLVRDSAESPHEKLRGDAAYLIAVARDDDAEAPQDVPALRDAAKASGADARIAVYPGDHGWCVLDSPAYNEETAEQAWTDLLAMYGAAL